MADLKIGKIRPSQSRRRKIIRTKTLKQEEKKTEYMTKLTERLEGKTEEERTIWESLKKIMKEEVEEILGVEWVGGNGKIHTQWWTEEVKTAVKKKTKMLIRWLRLRTVESQMKYVEARREAKQAMKRAKTSMWEEMGEKMIEDMRKVKKMLYGLAKSYRRGKTKQYNIKDEEGNVITEQEKIQNRWLEYFGELLNAEEGDEEEDLEEEEMEQDFEEIMVEEFDRALAKMKNGKTPGVDGTPIQLIKEGGRRIQLNILELLN